MNVIIETDRLLLRTFTLDDAALVFELNRSPDVTEFTGDPIRDIDHAREILESTILPQYVLYNYGRWAVHLKPDHDFIGWCGLKYRPELDEVDLGYRFAKAYWGKGYATEAAWACLRYGFDKLQLTRIVGRAMPGNLASIRVLQKCKMTYIGTQIVEEHPAETYEAIYPFIPSNNPSK